MDTARGTILVVDDEETIRKIVSRKLEADGYSCVHAVNGEDAIDKVSTQDFDLVLMDIKMPGLSGIEALPQMTFNQPDICVVMTTAVNDTQTTVEAMNLGAYDYVLKPFDLDDLGMRVEMALERKRVILDNKARASEHYVALVENIADAIFEIKKGVIAWCNEKAEYIFGYSREELIGKEAKSFFPSDIKLPGVDDSDECTSGALEVKNKNGDILHIEYSASRILSKEPVEIVAVLRDVTASKNARDKLRLAEEHYQTIFENTAVAITVTDQDEKIISWNKLAEQLLGMDEDDLYMKPVESLYPEDEWKKIRSQNVRQKGMQYHMETKIVKKDQSIIDVDLSVSVLKDVKGNITGSIGVILDITGIAELKRLKEDQEGLMKAYEEQSEIISKANIELEEALANVKTLSGLLPICAWCKNVRDDKGYWNQIESYISAHSETDFTHSICPDCAKEQGMPWAYDD